MEKRYNIETPYHINGHLHVTGKSKFIGEDIKPANLHYIKVVFSPYARAKILNYDFSEALKIDGVIAVLNYKDIPGVNQIGHVIKDEPLFPEEEVTYIGQPVCIVIAKTKWAAERGAKKIKIEYERLTPILTIDEALSKNQLYIPERKIERGNIENGFAKSDYIIEDIIENGGQEHFYMETQRCLAIPNEDNSITLYSATQSTSEVQEIAANVLGLKNKDITIDVIRLGGAFGGKERAATIWACLAALACYKTGKPVELKLTRHEDMIATGKRHPFKSKYKVGFTKEGKILSYSVELNSNGGAYTDLSIPILERAMLHADNCYYLENVKIIGRACRTNLPPNTAFRGFGAPQGILVIENAIEKIAETLNMDPLEVRLINAYKEGEKTPYGQPVHEVTTVELLEKLKSNSNYYNLKKETEKFNNENKFFKRGIGIIPIKFGISFTNAILNQGSALIWIYLDGSVSISHGGIEMGQELNTKVAQTVSKELGITLDKIKVESSNTKRIGNASPTAASTGADINCNAARNAALQIKERLKIVAAEILSEKNKINYNNEDNLNEIIFENNLVFDKRVNDIKITFEELIHHAYISRIDLGAHGFYRTPGIYFDREKGEGNPFYYFVFGCALVQVEVDILTGVSKLIKVRIIHEVGKSLNKEIDYGQILGAFFQGYGWSTFEELPFDENGRYLAVNPSTYKIPTINDLPEDIEVEIVEGEKKYSSIYSSKGIGEPPLIYGEAAYFAIKNALSYLNVSNKKFKLKFPATPEAVLSAIEEIK